LIDVQPPELKAQPPRGEETAGNAGGSGAKAKVCGLILNLAIQKEEWI
jgi:hypothetical protein